VTAGFRSCLLLIVLVLVVGIGGVGWLFSVTKGDPVAITYSLLDVNGALSKWEDRTVKIVQVERDCNRKPTVVFEHQEHLTPEICASSQALRELFFEKMKNETAGQLCFEDSKISKTCPGVMGAAANGEAIFKLEGINEMDGNFVSDLHVPSTENAFYLFDQGDKIVVSVCKKNPSVTRLKVALLGVANC